MLGALPGDSLSGPDLGPLSSGHREARAALHSPPKPPALRAATPSTTLGPKGNKARWTRSLLTYFQPGWRRPRGKKTGQALPRYRPSQGGASDPRLPAAPRPESLLTSVREGLPRTGRKTPCPPAPEGLPARSRLGPTQFPEAAATAAVPTAGRAQTETDHRPDGRAKHTKPPGDFCPDPGQSGGGSPGPGCDAGTGQGGAGLWRAQRPWKGLARGLPRHTHGRSSHTHTRAPLRLLSEASGRPARLGPRKQAL